MLSFCCGELRMYTIKRHILPILEKRFKNNIALSLSGARQVGKSTLCDHLFSDIKKINNT